MKRIIALLCGVALTIACDPIPHVPSIQGAGDDPHAVTVVLEDIRQPGHKYTYPNQADQTPCGSPLSIGLRSMPCGLVLNVCGEDRQSVIVNNHYWSCSLEMLTKVEACAEQPQFAYFYGCKEGS